MTLADYAVSASAALITICSVVDFFLRRAHLRQVARHREAWMASNDRMIQSNTQLMELMLRRPLRGQEGVEGHARAN